MSGAAVIDACRWMVAQGLVQGTSGNVSVRDGDAMIITPSAVSYDAMGPEMLCRVPLDGTLPEGGSKPSTEWPFHRAVFTARPDVEAVVHAHPVHATALACERRGIPPLHYMVAAFGGGNVPCTGYALFGSDALAGMVAEALADRDGCLMANHGAITVGATLDQALWRMQELEMLARLTLLAKEPVLLSEREIGEALEAFATYRPIS